MLLDKINKLKKSGNATSPENNRELNRTKKLKTDQATISSSSVFKNYAFMIYDGMGFFDFHFNKLPRLRGHQESIMDKFRDRKKIASFLVFFCVAVVVVIQEIAIVGTVKTQ